METEALIRTKLKPPTLGPDILPRPQLIKRLENGRYRKLTLISAPAGYGKSVLAGLWVKACSCQVAWLSLDKNDNELPVFLNYLVAAIQTLFPDSCKNMVALLNAEQQPPPDYLATAFINDTALIPDPFVIALDDYHFINNDDIRRIVSMVIQHQPEQMHLMLITRQDPFLILPNLRAKNQISEIRSDALSFTEDETRRFVGNALGARVNDDLVTRISAYTENWPAGIRLSCLAIRNQRDITLFQEGFQGSSQHIMSYLLDEFLIHQPRGMQRFLLSTAILDRFCAPLCDALNDQAIDHDQPMSSQNIINLLVQSNLFTYPLDHHGEWYRYHHLFQELLLGKLKLETSQEEKAALHKAAGNWLSGSGYVEEALDHYLLAEETDLAVGLIARQRYALMNAARWPQFDHYLNRFSPNVIEQYPDLLILKIWLMVHRGQLSELLPVLLKLDQLSRNVPPKGDVNGFQGEMKIVYSLLSMITLKPKQAISQARFALENTPPELWIVRVLARACLGASLQMIGDLQGAFAATYDGFSEEREQSDHFKATLIQTACNIYLVAADFDGLAQAARQNIEFSKNGSIVIQGIGRFHLGSALYQQNDLTGAETQFQIVVQEPYLNDGTAYLYSVIGLSLIYLAQGKPVEAQQTTVELVDFLLNIGNVTSLAIAQAFQADLALRQNNLTMASQWASQFQEPPPLIIAFRPYLPHLTLAKIWLAQKTPTSLDQTADLLDVLRENFTAKHNKRYLLEVLAIQALLQATKGEEDLALVTLEKALVLAYPGGFVRVFVDLGDQMALLLSKLTIKDAGIEAYRTCLLSAFPGYARLPTITAPHSNVDQAGNGQSLFTPLTKREMEVLALLAQRKTNREIAKELVITPHTVNAHLKNIYSKLNVNNRDQARQRAQELGLIPTN